MSGFSVFFSVIGLQTAILCTVKCKWQEQIYVCMYVVHLACRLQKLSFFLKSITKLNNIYYVRQGAVIVSFYWFIHEQVD